MSLFPDAEQSIRKRVRALTNNLQPVPSNTTWDVTAKINEATDV